MRPSIKRHLKDLFLLAYPVSLGQLSHILTNVADNIMLGKYDPTTLAASSFAFNVFISFLVFEMGLSMGITPLITSNNSKDQDTLKKLFQHGFYLYGGIGLLLSIILFFCTPLLLYFNQPVEVAILAQPYFKSLAVSLFPIMLFQLGKQYLEGLSNTKSAMYISIIGNLLNVIGNFALIYGVSELDIPEMGLIGAGYSTLFARCFMAIAILILIYKKYTEYFFIQLINIQVSIFQKINKISFPISIQMLMEVGAFAFTSIMVGWLNKENLVAHQIGISLVSMSYIVATGIGSAMTVKIGKLWHFKNKKLIQIVGNIGLVMSLFWMTFTMLFFWFGKDFLPLLYVQIEEQHIIKLTTSLLILAGIFQLPDGIQVVCSGILRGMNDVVIPTLLSVISYWIIAIPISYICAFWLEWQIYGIWFGLVIGLIFLSILLYIRFIYQLRKL